jgi:hypothetical protein
VTGSFVSITHSKDLAIVQVILVRG